MTAVRFRYPIEGGIQELEGREYFVLRDPWGISGPLALVREVVPVLALIDGTRSKAQLTEEVLLRGGTKEILEEVLETLDSALYLDGERFEREVRAYKDRYHAIPDRLPVCVGGVYPSDSTALRKEVYRFLDEGRSIVQKGCGGGDNAPTVVVSPHIDYARGGRIYGGAYAGLKSGAPMGRPDEHTVLLIGTCHQHVESLFQVTRKNFISPLGTLRSATTLIDELAARYGSERSFGDELAHRNEHSLELQVPFLAALAPSIRIVPVLVGSFHQFVSKGEAPKGVSGEYDDFVGALSEVLGRERAIGRSITIVAGVDIAHVGSYFGDRFPITDEVLEEVRYRDFEYLATLEQRNRHALFEHIAQDNDKRRVCGFPTMYVVLDLVERLGIELTPSRTAYHQAVSRETGTVVSIAAMNYGESLS